MLVHISVHLQMHAMNNAQDNVAHGPWEGRAFHCKTMLSVVGMETNSGCTPAIRHTHDNWNLELMFLFFLWWFPVKEQLNKGPCVREKPKGRGRSDDVEGPARIWFSSRTFLLISGLGCLWAARSPVWSLHSVQDCSRVRRRGQKPCTPPFGELEA